MQHVQVLRQGFYNVAAVLSSTTVDSTLLLENIPASSVVKISIPLLGLLLNPTVEVSPSPEVHSYQSIIMLTISALFRYISLPNTSHQSAPVLEEHFDEACTSPSRYP